MTLNGSHSPGTVGQASILDRFPREENSENGFFKSNTECWVCRWSPDNTIFAWSCGRRLIKLIPVHLLFSIEDPEGAMVTIDAGYVVWSLAFSIYSECAVANHPSTGRYRRLQSASSSLIAAGLANGHIRIWDIETGIMVLELMDHTGLVRDLQFCPRGSLLLASASRDCTIKLWDLPDDGNLTATLHTKGTGQAKHWVCACAWSPDGRLLASVGSSKFVSIWDMDSTKFSKLLRGHYHEVVSCQFSTQGDYLATASFDTRVILWDVPSGNPLLTLWHMVPPPSKYFVGGAHDVLVRSVSVSCDGLHVATVADDGLVRVWNLEDTSSPESVAAVPKGLSSSYSKDGKVLAVGNRMGSVYFIACETGVKSLAHQSRMSVLASLDQSSGMAKLSIPTHLKRYLAFSHVGPMEE